MTPMSRMTWKSLPLLSFALALAGHMQPATAMPVDCDNGGMIQPAIDSGFYDLIEFTGTCHEDVSVPRAGVQIRGMSVDRSLHVIDGHVSVEGATRVQFRDLTITGGNVVIFDGAYVTLRNVAVEDTDNGVTVVRNSTLRLRDSDLGPALVDQYPFSCGPLCVGDASHIRMEGSNIVGDTDDPLIGGAVVIYRDSSLTMRGGNTITNNGSEPSLAVVADSSLRLDDATGKGPDAVTGEVEIFGLSFAQLGSGSLTGPVKIDLQSVLRAGGTVAGGDPAAASINGPIEVSRASALAVDSPTVTINGTVTCLDIKSSLSGSFSGTYNISCRDFDGKAVDKD
jgi:hypothetical protein